MDDSRDTKGDRPVLTGWRGVVRENYTGEIKGSLWRLLWAFGTRQYLLGGNYSVAARRAPEGPQMTTAELPEHCLYQSSSRVLCGQGVPDTPSRQLVVEACEAAPHCQRRWYTQGSIIGSHGWERTRNSRDGAWGSSRCLAIFAVQS